MEIDELLKLESQLRRSTVRRLLAADAVLMAACAASYLIASRIASPETMVWVRGACFITAGLQIAVIICVVAEMLGYPVELTMDLGPTPAGRAFIHELMQRPTISDDEFTARFGNRYFLSGDELRRIRKVLRDMDTLCDRVEPQEAVSVVLDDLDFYDLYVVLAREFGVRLIPLSQDRKDGSLDMVIGDVQNVLRQDSCLTGREAQKQESGSGRQEASA